MLDFMNLKKNDITCSLCNETVRNDNCSPKGCNHVFHSSCFEGWTVAHGSSEEYICPAPGCTSKFFEIVVRKIPHGLATKIVSLKESHQCPICCEPLQTPVAMPESCNHTFCYVCLREWSRVRHECPLDRGSFELILLSETIGGPITKRVAPPPVQPLPDEPPEILDTQCEVCGLPTDEDQLLLCDHCDRGYHTYCLPTPLSSIPPGDWFCPDCVRHGIGIDTAHVNNASSPVQRRSRRRRTTTLAEREAVESEHEDEDEVSMFDDDSNDESFHVSGELSVPAQRRLTRQATRRHRGARLLQDTISRLAARIFSETANRQQRRVRSQHRPRSERTRSTTSNAPSQTVLVRSTESGQSSALQIARNVNPSSHTNGINSAGSSDAAARRRRLFILSDSSSEEEENGIPLRLPRLTDVHRRRRPRPLIESDGHNLEPDSIVPSNVTTERRPAKRLRTFSTASSERSPPPSDSGVREMTVTHYESDLQPDATAAPLQQTSRIRTSSSSSSSASTVSFSAAVPKPKQQMKKRKKVTRRKKRLQTRGNRKVRTTTSGRRKRVSRTRLRRVSRLSLSQKKIKKKAIVVSKSPSTSTGKSSNSRSPLKSSILPKLSILGAEPSYSLNADVDSPDDFEPAVPQVSKSKPEPSTSGTTFRPAASSLLRDIENGQTSLFKFTTRHMRVNSDHSLSPIAVGKTTIQLPTENPSSPDNCPRDGSSDTSPQVPSTSKKSAYFTASSKHCAPHPTIKTSRIERNFAHTTTTTNSVSSSLDANTVKGWSVERIAHARSVLEKSLTPHLSSGHIDQAMYRQIIERALTKIKQKDFIKVTDGRIVKLAGDYVEYMQRRTVT